MAPGLDEFDVLLEVVLSLVRVRLPFCLHLLDALLCGRATLFKFKGDYSTFSGVRILNIFMVYIYILPRDTSFFLQNKRQSVLE